MEKFTARFKKQYSRFVGGFVAKKYAENMELREVCELVGVELEFGDEVQEGESEEGVSSEEEDELAGEDADDEDEVDQLVSSPPLQLDGDPR